MSSVESLDQDELYLPVDDSSFSERYFGLSSAKALFALIVVVGFGLYISLLLFGDNSVNVLFTLEEYESYLSDEVVRLKTENAMLQKEHFELLELNSQ